MSATSKAKSSQKGKIAPRIIWFDIPADNLERASKFYGNDNNTFALWETNNRAK